MNGQRENCLNCTDKIAQPTKGRKRKFCSNRCKTAYQREKIRREQIAAQQRLIFSHLTQSKQWAAFDPNTTCITLTRIAQDYGAEAVLLAMQAIKQEVTAQCGQLPRRVRKTRNRKETEAIEVEVIVGEAEQLPS